MRPAANVYANHVLATVPKVSVVLHDPPSTGDTGFLALSRELDGHAVELFPGTRYNEGDTLTVSVTYDGGGPRAAYARHGRGSWSREEHGTVSISSWGEMLLAATQYLDGREPTAWSGKEAS